MNKYTDAIRFLKSEIKELAERKALYRRLVQERKYDAEGKRRPETGPMRHSLKLDYDWHDRPKTRAALLAYGFLKGVPYKVMERSAVGAVPYSLVLKAIHKACGDSAELKAEWDVNRIIDIVLKGADSGPVLPKTEAEPPTKGLMARILGAVL